MPCSFVALQVQKTLCKNSAKWRYQGRLCQVERSVPDALKSQRTLMLKSVSGAIPKMPVKNQKYLDMAVIKKYPRLLIEIPRGTKRFKAVKQCRTASERARSFPTFSVYKFYSLLFFVNFLLKT